MILSPTRVLAIPQFIVFNNLTTNAIKVHFASCRMDFPISMHHIFLPNFK